MTNSKTVNNEISNMTITKVSKKELSAYSIAFIFMAIVTVISIIITSIV